SAGGAFAPPHAEASTQRVVAPKSAMDGFMVPKISADRCKIQRPSRHPRADSSYIADYLAGAATALDLGA
ncbi:hypothetical protein, partial [Salmonella enterica]|uniref:hypothetical protein n=1 Tax=Salmonella enterica TaxID=28901 RepID=UPI0019D6A093